MSNNSSKSTGFGCFTGTSLILTLIFVVLRWVANPPVITWAWYWVFSPLWIEAGLGIVILLIVGVLLIIAKLLD